MKIKSHISKASSEIIVKLKNEKGDENEMHDLTQGETSMCH